MLDKTVAMPDDDATTQGEPAKAIDEGLDRSVYEEERRVLLHRCVRDHVLILPANLRFSHTVVTFLVSHKVYHKWCRKWLKSMNK